MEILPRNVKDLLEYLPHVKSTVKEWVLVDILITDKAGRQISAMQAAEAVQSYFSGKEGRLFIHNDKEVLVLIHLGRSFVVSNVLKEIERLMPQGAVEVRSQETTFEGLGKLELHVTHQKSFTFSLADIRKARRENVVLIADDDMYVRMLVNKGLSSNATVLEVAEGDKVMEAFRSSIPDLVFLDIHLPGLSGATLLQEILQVDPKAYVVMLSADSSVANVSMTTHAGAKAFLTKPFSRERLIEYCRRCPTFIF
ncbi:MAG: response regulator [Alphaproteobacteria bacterium]|nr:response regulator [Alphaproteobacteria bacterium]